MTARVSGEFLERAREAGTYGRLVRALKHPVDLTPSGDADALLEHLVRPCCALLVRVGCDDHHRTFAEPWPLRGAWQALLRHTTPGTAFCRRASRRAAADQRAACAARDSAIPGRGVRVLARS